LNGMRKRGMMGFPGYPVNTPLSAWRKALNSPGSGQRTLYVHIPFCKTRCSFCPFYFGPAKGSEMEDYVRLLVKELETWAHTKGIKDYPVNAVYFGGGTPTDMEAGDFEKILAVLRKNYTLSADCEITVEGRINGFTEDKMKACVESGVNRFSIGVQTFNTRIRRSLGRTSSKSKVIDTLEKLISLNHAAVVIDLLYGLPGQNVAAWLEDQRIVLEDLPISGLDHYRLNVHEKLPLFQMAERGKCTLPDSDECYKMYILGEEIMKDAGAVRLSISHYALDYRERNANNDVSGRKNICLPFGLKAGGRLGNFFFHQTADLPTYKKMVMNGDKPLGSASEMPADYAVCKEIAGQIGRKRGINIETAAGKDHANAAKIISKCSPLLWKWVDSGLLSPGHMGFLRLSSEAMFRYKELASELMETVASAYVPQKGN